MAATTHASQVETEMRVNNKWMKIGTVVAGIATAVLVAFEIYRVVPPMYLPFLTIVYAYFFGALSALAISLSLSKIQRKKK